MWNGGGACGGALAGSEPVWTEAYVGRERGSRGVLFIGKNGVSRLLTGELGDAGKLPQNRLFFPNVTVDTPGGSANLTDNVGDRVQKKFSDSRAI